MKLHFIREISGSLQVTESLPRYQYVLLRHIRFLERASSTKSKIMKQNITRAVAGWKPGIASLPELVEVEYFHNLEHLGPDAADHAPILVLPGYGEEHFVISHLLGHMAASGVPAVAPVLPFHRFKCNDASIKAGLTEPGFVVMEDIGHPDAIRVLSHSQGGAANAHMLRHAPERIERSAMIAPAGFTNFDNSEAHKTLRILGLASKLGLNALQVIDLSMSYMGAIPDVTRRVVEDIVTGRSIPKFDYATRVNLEHYATKDPSTLVLVGENDHVFSPFQLAVALPDPAKILVVKGQHEIMSSRMGLEQVNPAYEWLMSVPLEQIRCEYGAQIDY